MNVPDVGGWLRGVADVAVALRRGQHALLRRYVDAALDASRRAKAAERAIRDADALIVHAIDRRTAAMVSGDNDGARRWTKASLKARRWRDKERKVLAASRDDVLTYRNALEGLDLPADVRERVLSRLDARLAAREVEW